MKVVMEFELPEDKEELDIALKASRQDASLHRIWEEVFRPARKHGYASSKLQKLMEQPYAEELVWELETLFVNILEEEELL